MSEFLLLALGASLVLLVLESAWLVRVPHEKYKSLIRRSVYISGGLVVLGSVAVNNWHWAWIPVGIALLFGEPIQHRVFGNKARGREPSKFVRLLLRTFQSRTATNASARENATAAPPPRSDMTRDQARRILGLSTNATEQQVKEAHRRLMRRVHPDRGGSSQHAAQINRAKDVLLGD